jgi:molybdate transport system substrate-binding protein
LRGLKRNPWQATGRQGVSTAARETAPLPKIGKEKTMERKNKCYLVLPILLVMLALMMNSSISCTKATGTLSVFAAAGTKPAFDEVGERFTEEYGTAVELTYAGGGEVLNQMVLSQSGDVYVAPEQRFMDSAVEKGAVDAATITSVAYMIPVIGVTKGNPMNIQTLADLARPGIRVAVTRPETTLLGDLAPEIFEKAGLSEAISQNIVTEAARPDNIVTMLIMGQVDAGIIWNFYQVQDPDDIEVIYLPPEQLTGVGEIQIAISTYSQDKKTAQQFIDYVVSSSGKEIFKKCGYLVNSEEVSQYWH